MQHTKSAPVCSPPPPVPPSLSTPPDDTSHYKHCSTATNMSCPYPEMYNTDVFTASSWNKYQIHLML